MSDLRTPILVTGAGGFIGRRLVALLLEKQLPVSALLLDGEPVPPDWGDRVTLVRGNVCDAAQVRTAVEGIGTIFHLAALVGISSTYEEHWAVTAEGSRNVYTAAAEAGARVVVTTSICAYGDRIAREECREDAKRGVPQGPYGRAKQAQEDFALEAQAQHGLSVTIVRPSNVYGVGSGPWVEFLAAGLQAGLVCIVDDGTANAGLVHVQNLVEALVAIAENDATIGHTYNVCDGLDVTWRRYMEDIARIVGVTSVPAKPLAELRAAALANEDLATLVAPKDPSVLPLEALNLVGSDNRFDTTAIRRDVGWAPHVTYDDALREIADSLTNR